MPLLFMFFVNECRPYLLTWSNWLGLGVATPEIRTSPSATFQGRGRTFHRPDRAHAAHPGKGALLIGLTGDLPSKSG